MKSYLQLLDILACGDSETKETEIKYGGKLPTDIIRALADDEDERVRECLAWWRNLPPDIILQLAKDKSPMVRHVVMGRQRVPVRKLREIILNDPDSAVRRTAQYQFDHPHPYR
jgi:hypothetical protein